MYTILKNRYIDWELKGIMSGVLVAHTCNPSYSVNQEDCSLKPAPSK
jgi:hypothetical protein